MASLIDPALRCRSLANRPTALFQSSRLLSRSGDVHPNPGPATNSDDLDTSSLSSSYSNLINSGLSVVHLNVQSLRPKLDIIEIELQSYDILIFSETWLSPDVSNDNLSITNFNPPFRCDRVGRPGGGVAIYVRDGITATERPDLSVNGVEAIWIEIQLSRKKLLVGGFYRPPNSNNNHWNLMEHSFDQAFNQTVADILIAGDFNINQTMPSNKLSNLIKSYNAHQLINNPTHFTENSNSIIDVFIVKHAHNVISSFVSDPITTALTRYHCPIACVLKFTKPKTSNYKRHVWLYDRGDYNEFRNKLQSINWENTLNSNNIDQTASTISDTIISAASQTIPNKQVTIRPDDIPWINNTIRKQMNTRNKIHKRAKQQNTEAAWSNFRKSRNKVTYSIRKAKETYEIKLINQINTSNISSKTWFKLVKNITNKQTKSIIPTLIVNKTTASTDQEKTEMLNNYFCQQSTLPDEKYQPLPNLPNANSVLPELTISPQDVKDAITSVDPSKACGPDLVGPRLIREGAPVLAAPLSVYFTNLLHRSVFPSAWKLANVTPIFKKGDPSNAANYRPISLLSCLGKLMERCVHKALYNYFVSNNLLSPLQSGFIKGDSTINQLTFLYNDVCKALDEGKEVRSVFCDISKAFDRVWHRGLLHKLSALGISGSLLRWFSSYLSSRQQRVLYAGSSSSWSSINAGVPQGSILGPLLFLVYINDITTDINANIRLFADDTSLYIVVDHPDTASTVLNRDLQTVYSWSQTWLVSFNPVKSKSMLFSRKIKKPVHPQLHMNNIAIEHVESHKHLGITLSSDAKWTQHISLMLGKAWKRIGLLRSLKHHLNRPCLEKMYMSFIRPLLEYGDILWDNCTNQQKSDIESVQNEAARIVSGATKYCNIQSMLAELKWETLADRRKKHKLITLYKMNHTISPQYLIDLLPAHEQTRYNLRTANNIPSITARTQLYQNSFLPATIREWNNLPLNVRNLPTLNAFKQALKSNICKPKAIFSFGPRNAQILHTRLRLGCSSLNYDLHRRSIADSPLCRCGSVETVDHFLLHCPLLADIRIRFFTNMPCAPIYQNLLFGNDASSIEQNKIIFSLVQEYIIASRRFG